MEPKVAIALFVFVTVYVFLSTERIHRTKATLAGASIFIIAGIVSQQKAFASVDFNTIFLLLGMMVLVNVTKETGIFEFVAIKGLKIAKGDPWKILIIFYFLTAIISAFLDNVTTVILFAPIVLFVSDVLRIPSFPYLVSLILAANIGGTATLIGAPPNIMIASASGYDFLDFFFHVFPIAILILLVNLVLLWLFFRKSFQKHDGAEAVKLDANKALKDKKLLIKAIIVLILTIVGFTLHGLLNIEPATVAMSGAALMLLLIKGDPARFFEKVEWNTLFFFGGLFVLVGGLEQVGVIEEIFKYLTHLTDNVAVLSMIFLFGGALCCSFIDNIPFTAMMIPLVSRIVEHIFPSTLGAAETNAAAVGSMALWWSLSLGANLGGNGTIIAASPNVVLSGIAEQSGNKIKFSKYFKYGITSVLISTVVAAVYVWLRYL
ncbi:ArsB/NhaD family transporter [bacterium]|nr:ArsB/NhaD family transporter [bacterium]